MGTHLRSVLLALVVLGTMALGSPAEPPPDTSPSTPPAAAEGRSSSGQVLESMNSAGYTYLQVDTGDATIWVAAPEFVVSVGDTVIVPEGLPMVNYHSKTLGRTFDLVYFVGAVRVVGAEPDPHGSLDIHRSRGDNEKPREVDFSDIQKPRGGWTVEELYAEKEGLAGSEVRVRGRVVKFSSGIMGKNWIHLRDGTGVEGTNDLTVSTSTFAEVGDIVLVRGILTRDKDLGFGYYYELIIEDGEVTVE